MNRDEILAMKPGRELDSAIKRHIFGIDVTVDNYYKLGIGYYKVEPYSVDIASAWEVVEKIWNLPDVTQNPYSISKYTMDNGINGYCVEWCYWGLCIDGGCNKKACNGTKDKYVIAETAPEAICKSALLFALEVD